MEYTKQCNLKKPGVDDSYNIADFNDNFDIIDPMLYHGQQGWEQSCKNRDNIVGLQNRATALEKTAPIKIWLIAPQGATYRLEGTSHATLQGTICSTNEETLTVNNLQNFRLTMTYNGKYIQRTLFIDRPGITRIAYMPSLEESSWELIGKVTKWGLAEECWNVGDTKTVTVGDEEMTVRILDFNHDDRPSGFKITQYQPGEGLSGKGLRKKANITFALTEPLAEDVRVDSSIPTGAGEYSWADREIFKTTLPAKKALLPSDLQSVIKTVQKVVPKAVNTDGTIEKAWKYPYGIEVIDTDLFTLSEVELFGAAHMGPSFYNYERPYDYYCRGNSFVASKAYWLRGQGWGNHYDAQNACHMNEDGTVGGAPLTNTKGLLFGFCV